MRCIKYTTNTEAEIDNNSPTRTKICIITKNSRVAELKKKGCVNPNSHSRKCRLSAEDLLFTTLQNWLQMIQKCL